MPEEPSPNRSSSETCPRCGAPLHRTSAGLTCFRCLGERALQFDDQPEPLASIDDLVSGGASATPGPALERLGGYELLDEIGRGGMGVVYTARQSGLDRVVALKVIAQGRLATAEIEMRFLREAQTAARLRHRHILTVHDAGRADGHAFYTMDYVESGDLARRLREGPIEFHTAAEIVAACAAAIAYAHAQGVLHRDLKPSNILLDGNEPRIADFGLASSLSDGAELTAHTRVLGTPHYLAPETIAGGIRSATPASDVYALGAILFELVVGRPPFGGATSAQVLSSAGKQEAPVLRLLNPAVPRDLETIVAKALENDPARRYRDAGELAADLRRFLAGELILARPVHPAERFLRWCRRRPALASAWFLVAALAVGSTLAAFRIQRERRRAETGETRAVAAEQAALTQLAAAKLAEARALRVTGRDGRRFAALEALREAAKIKPTAELRDEAASLLTLFDARVSRQWQLGGSSPDATLGFSLATNSYVIDLEKGKPALRRLDDDRDLVRLDGVVETLVGTPRFSRRGRWVAVRDMEDTLHVWNTKRGGAPALTLKGRTAPLAPVAKDFAFDFDFSPDESVLLVGKAPSGLERFRLPSDDAAGNSATAASATSDVWPVENLLHVVRFSRDGRQVAVATPQAKNVRVLDAANGSVLHTIELPTPAIGVEWSPDGKLLATSLRVDRVLIHEVDTGATRATLRMPDTIPTQLVFTPDGRGLLAAGIDRAIVVWDWARERVVLRIENWGANPVLDLSPDGRRLASSMWSLDTAGVIELSVSPIYRLAPSIVPGADRVSPGAGGVAVSADGRLAAVANLAGVQVRLLDNLADSALISFEARGDCSAAFSPDGRWAYVASLGSGVARCPVVIDAVTNRVSCGAPEFLFREAGWRVYATAPNDGRLVLASHEGGKVRVVSWGDPGATVEWKSEGVWCAAFSPDGKLVATQSGSVGFAHDGPGAELRDSRSGALVRAMPGGRLGEVSWSASGALAVLGAREMRWYGRPTDANDAGRVLWNDLAQGATLVAASADGTLLAHSTGEGIELVRVSDGERLVKLRAVEQTTVPFALRFTSDGSRLVANNGTGALVVWELAALHRELKALGLDW